MRYLRLIRALGATPAVVSTVFDALYTTGCDPESDAAWEDVLARLGQAASAVDLGVAEVKNRLKDNTTQAANDGVFGVRTIVFGDRLFWGLDALSMLRAHLRDDPRMQSTAM